MLKLVFPNVYILGYGRSLKITRMSFSSRVQEANEQLKSNSFYEKYAVKISTFQNTCPEEFLSRVEKQSSKSRSRLQSLDEKPISKVSSPITRIGGALGPLCERKEKGCVIADTSTEDTEEVLSDIMKVEMITNKTPDEIKQIWKEYYNDKDAITATIPTIVYDKIYSKSRQFPVFLFPLPRGHGYEFILCQFSGHEVHFTPLINYQAHQENAPECLSMVHFPDLKEEKGIVLMHGEFDKNIINSKEAQCLANQLQMYYAQDNEKKLKLLERFTKYPNTFKHMDLIAELESLSL